MKRFSLVLLSITVLYGCDGKSRTLMGTSREVLMVYSEDSKFSAGALYKYMTRLLYTPQPETLLYIRPVKWDKFSKFENYRNKVLFLLPNDSLWKICKDEEGVFFRSSMFVRGDFVVLVCSYDSRAMLRMIADNATIIRDTLLNNAIRDLSSVEFMGGRDSRLMKRVEKEFQLKINFPAGWKVYRKGEGFISLVKHNPTRFIFIYSEPHERAIELNEVLDLRDSLTSTYYGGDSVIRDHVTSMTDNVAGLQIFKVYGLWKNDTLLAGGPFVTYAFNRDGKFYMLDAGVFAPESQNKVNLILRVEGIIRSME